MRGGAIDKVQCRSASKDNSSDGGRGDGKITSITWQFASADLRCLAGVSRSVRRMVTYPQILGVMCIRPSPCTVHKIPLNPIFVITAT